MIPNKQHFTNGYERRKYYQSLVSDYLAMIGQASSKSIPKENIRLYTTCILIKRKHRELQFTFSVLLSMYIYIYETHSDIYTLNRLYQGIKKQQSLLFGLQRNLKNIVVPAQYYKAILYEFKSINDRIEYLKPIMQHYIAISPLADYEKTLPEDISLIDDIWNHIADWEDITTEERSDNIKTYIQHILTAIDIHSVNEARIKYDKQQKTRTKSNKQDNIQKKKDRAIDIASYKADILWKHLKTGRTTLANKIYGKCLDLPEAKIFLLVRVSSAFQNTGMGQNSVWYIDANGELTTAPTKSQVFPVDAPLPNNIQKLIDDNTFVYTEMIIK